MWGRRESEKKSELGFKSPDKEVIHINNQYVYMQHRKLNSGREQVASFHEVNTALVDLLH